MKKIGSLVMVFTLSILLFAQAPRAWACSCAAADDETHFENAAVVFVGEARRSRDPNADRDIQSTGDPITWTFKAESVQKGVIDERQEVVTARDGATCGFGFTVGRRYQVFAWSSDGDLHTGLCSGTRDLAGAGAYREDDPLAGARIRERVAEQPSEEPETKQEPTEEPKPSPTRTSAAATPTRKASPLFSETSSPVAAPRAEATDQSGALAATAGTLLTMILIVFLLVVMGRNRRTPPA